MTKQEQFEQTIKAQLDYAKEFFTRDQKSANVRYCGPLINPLSYVAATVLAIFMYIDYLKFDHFEKLSNLIESVLYQIGLVASNRKVAPDWVAL